MDFVGHQIGHQRLLGPGHGDSWTNSQRARSSLHSHLQASPALVAPSFLCRVSRSSRPLRPFSYSSYYTNCVLNAGNSECTSSVWDAPTMRHLFIYFICFTFFFGDLAPRSHGFVVPSCASAFLKNLLQC